MNTVGYCGNCIRWRFAGLAGLLLLMPAVVSCSSSQQPDPKAEANSVPGWPKGNEFFHEASYDRVASELPTIADAEFVEDDEFCMTCHEAHASNFEHNVHRGQSCESCHGPASRHLETQGKEPGLILSFKKLPGPQKAELCLKCHEQDQCSPGAQWRHSKHAHCGVSCTDCHQSHYNVPAGTPILSGADVAGMRRNGPPIRRTSWQEPGSELPSLAGTSNNLGATSPGTCYKCHGDKLVYQQIAGPHQICGPNGFNCTTCHDPHGNVREYSRKDMCLECHAQESPGMAFDTSCHNRKGVACTDCHNPHPRTDVPRVVNISHTSIDRAPRLPMSVDDPRTCYKCHPKIFGMNSLPSHHPIKEGKMKCSDCHNPHGELEGNLKADSINLLCAECHAEKEGPFTYEHPPVSENCNTCHEPHGTVTNNLLRQPATFLCLRCHAGHRRAGHPGANGAEIAIDTNPALRPSYYTDCTHCHAQIHGSDLPSLHDQQSLLR